MSIIPLKRFQERAVKSGVELFTYAKYLLDSAADDTNGKATAIHQYGYLLIEAPTGSGKTLMAGSIAERMSHVDDVVWFWFAPFKGVVDQTAAFLREQFAGLRLRTLSEDRIPIGSRRGDVFVTTWQTVATKAKNRRNVRKSSELNPSVDELLVELRRNGIRIGVVVDEAHHGFHGETQAAEFFRTILQPEYTILITATPDDADLDDLQQRMQLGNLYRITISREDAVASGLIKNGIKCIAWKAEEGKESLVDFEATALTEGARLHKRLKDTLKEEGIALIPLMLVQVDSTAASVERAKEQLLHLGFTDSQIAIHTAEEPDAGLLALANDEAREVLIFKMAVALGFDAPRAWSLVSMRAARDEDFGIQLVGRILRVHRRFQGRNVPELLRYGYVLLADSEAQTGIDTAGQRINRLRTEYAKFSPTTVVVQVGTQQTVQVLDQGGQASFFAIPPAGAIWQGVTLKEKAGVSLPPDSISPQAFNIDFLYPSGLGQSIVGRPAPQDTSFSSSHVLTPRYRYALRPDVPKRFKVQSLPDDFDATEEDCARKFIVSAEQLLDVILTQGKMKVQRWTLEIFTHQLQMELEFAPISRDQIQVQAQKLLLRSPVFHPKDLRRALLQRLQAILKDRGADDADDLEKTGDYLDLLLVTRPELLAEAQRAALVRGTQIVETEELPSVVESDEPHPNSPLNIYTHVPSGLNSWEKDFTELLDSDMTGTVLWWHRNPVNKPWSVKLLLSDGRGFYPDFVIGIKDRPKDNGILLSDTKHAFELRKELPKILAEHASYGKVLILNRIGEHQWGVVRFDEPTGRAMVGNQFRFVDAAGY